MIIIPSEGENAVGSPAVRHWLQLLADEIERIQQQGRPPAQPQRKTDRSIDGFTLSTMRSAQASDSGDGRVTAAFDNVGQDGWKAKVTVSGFQSRAEAEEWAALVRESFDPSEPES